MKKISYYVAAFALCCGVSQTLTSCVDETAEPEYVKEIRESEMAKELAENGRDAKKAGKESEAAFTEAFLNGTLSSTTAYTEYNLAKKDFEDAEKAFKAAEALLTDPEWVATKAKKIASLEYDVVAKQEAKNTKQDNLDNNTSTNKLTIANLKKELAEAEAELQEAKDLLKQYQNDAFNPVKHTSFVTWQDVYENYLYTQEDLAKKQETYTAKKEIYDKAIEAMQKANKE